MSAELNGTTAPPQLPSALLKDVLRDAQRQADTADAMLAGVEEHRHEWRQLLLDAGQIVPLPAPPTGLTLAAVDGGCVVDQMYAADRVLAAAVVAEGLRTEKTGELHHALWIETMRHQPDVDRLASAVMIGLELVLISRVSYDVRIFDGSHQTPVIALNSGLSSINPDVREMAAHVVRENDVVGALRAMCDPVDGAMIVGLPKADSSTAFCEKYARDYGFDLPRRDMAAPVSESNGPSISDRFLAAQLLDRGEMLLPRKPEDWHQLHIGTRSGDSPEKRQWIVDIAKELDAAIEPLRRCGEAGQGVGITYVKPPTADTCIKIEFKASRGIEHGKRLGALLGAEVSGPHMFEPFAQYVADLWAKNISIAADAVSAAALHKMPTDASYRNYLRVGHRTPAQAPGGLA